MAQYHIGCGAFGIYAGTVNKNNTMWVNKSDVTNEALLAVAQYLLQKKEGLIFECDGEKYLLSVTKYNKEESKDE